MDCLPPSVAGQGLGGSNPLALLPMQADLWIRRARPGQIILLIHDLFCAANDKCVSKYNLSIFYSVFYLREYIFISRVDTYCSEDELLIMYFREEICA